MDSNFDRENGNLSTQSYWVKSQESNFKNISSKQETSEEQAHWWQMDANSYTKYLVNKFYEKYLPKGNNLSFIEVGAAPGRNLIIMHNKFGYNPFGVEYTEIGYEQIKKMLLENNLPTDNAIHADFFDQSFSQKYTDCFDIVASFGFLEHFDNPKEVVEKHLNILKSGGHLFIIIPNFRYINYWLRCFFNTNFIETHNLELMDLNTFKNCFVFDNFQIEECCYLGSFMFPQPTHTSPSKRYVEKILGKLQIVINALSRNIFVTNTPESKYFSQSLVCVGKKI